MKKRILILMLVALMVITGCTKIEDEGIYKEGTYFGSALDNYGGSNSVATAVVYVDSNGNIKSVYLDTTFEKDGVITTKKTLGEDYGMRIASPISKEWFEQVEALESAIVEKQKLDFIEWTDDDKSITDSISGVTMKIDALYAAVKDAIAQAE